MASSDDCSAGYTPGFQLHPDGLQTIEYNGDPSYVIGINASSQDSGAEAILWTSNGKSNQDWLYDPASS
jgi:hypothetical protein